MRNVIAGFLAMTMLSGCFTMNAKMGGRDTSYFVTVPADILTLPLQVVGIIVFGPFLADMAKIK